MSIHGSTTFIGNSAGQYGGGISAQDYSNVNISGYTTFSGNSANNGGGVSAEYSSNVRISASATFIHNSASYGGGVSVQKYSNVEVRGNTTMRGNSAIYGGGIGAQYNSKVEIGGNTTFIGNSAGQNGGGVNVQYSSNVNISRNTTFSGNSACYGGGVYAELKGTVNISGNTTFSDNSAAQYGGGVSAVTSSIVNINGNTIFRNNSATNGGAVSAQWSSNVDISGNISFRDNSANDGGGLSAQDNSNVHISGNTTFQANSASDRGGGVNVKDSTNVDIRGNTTFIGNSASYGGGISANMNSNVNISGNSIVIGNSARWYGGGVYANSYRNVNIGGSSTFSANSGRNGGCIYANYYDVNLGGVSTFKGTLSLKGFVTFTNCSATNDGGAIYAKGIRLNFSGSNVPTASTAAHIYVHTSSLNPRGSNIFMANSAGSRGGGIYVQNAKMIFNCTGMFSGNMAQLDGGGIYADSSNLTFRSNITIKYNTAQLGGGIYSDNNTFNIDGNNIVERNVATYYGGGIFMRRTHFICSGRNTLLANFAGEGGGIYATANSNLSLDGVNTFMANRAHVSGGGMWLDNSNLTLNGSNHFVECVASYEGGAIFTYAARITLIGNNIYESNSATSGGGVHARWSNVSVTSRTNFKHNTAVFGGGVFIDSSTFKFSGYSSFLNNQANHTGGSVYASKSVLNFLGTSSVTNNYAARDGGGIYTRDGCVINLLGLSNYKGNSAGDTGGGISLIQSSISLAGQNRFDSNNAVEGGGLYALKCTVNFPGENTFITNSARYHGGGFTVIQSKLHLNGSTTFRRNSAAIGGGMHIVDSTADIDGRNCFSNNAAKSEGGVVYAKDSLVEFSDNGTYIANTAGSKGAAIHTSFSTLIFQGISFFANNSARYGGGIYSESSNLTFARHKSSHQAKMPPSSIDSKTYSAGSNFSISFVNNTAFQGGAQYLDVKSNFSLHPTAYVHFLNNNATEFGGAIYVVDAPLRSECFFHILNNKSPNMEKTPLLFENNFAGRRGSVVYGGLLDKCTFTSDKYKSALDLFNMSILQGNTLSHSISSDPTQLCFCNKTELDSSVVSLSRSIYPGQSVQFSVIAIDQSHLGIPTLIHTAIRSGCNISETTSYEIGGKCTTRSVTPKTFINQLELYCSKKLESTSHLLVNITFDKCPIGFEPSNFTGDCICDHRLWQFTNSCDIDRQTILRNRSSTFWLGVSYNNGTAEGFILHHYCPLDYCISESNYINLNNPDKQCEFNRSGLLCGKCKESLSLVLGSYQCKKCSNNYLALLIPFALAGALLVLLLFLLHLTVAAGTLHGLIFYANIVEANYPIFFPQSSNDPASIFISWLNLDFGIQTCFYNGMDAYAKTWLEMVFPVYIWGIVGFLMYISNHSITVTKYLGSSPVPVLASLFFLSYAKVLRTIISALSLTILHYPDKDVVVWIHDANVSMAKYIPLALVALFFLLFLFLPYTLLLLLGHWLQSKSHLRILSWVNNTKLKAILDAYHAPYQLQHRYWTGMLLLIRCVLFLIFAFNVSGDDSINTLVISLATSAIFAWFTLCGMVYKSWHLNAIEVSFILNLGILAAVTHHANQSGGNQAAVACTSVGVASLTFVGIVIYHIYKRIKSKMPCTQGNHQFQCRSRMCHTKYENNTNPRNLEYHSEQTPNEITHTVVDLCELRSPLNLLDTRSTAL